MPFIRRMISFADESGFSSGIVPHEHWVPKGQVRPTDVIIPPEDIDPVRLDDLILTHPEEYGHLQPTRAPRSFDDDPEVQAINEAGAIAQMDEEGAIAAIGASQNARMLDELLQLEDRPRVLEALASRGFAR